MCRNIRTLFNFQPPATATEVEAAAMQYVRKVSGFRKPSRANLDVFDEAVSAVASATTALLATLETSAPPRNREVEAARAMARAKARFG